jgi:hypothetical protein
VVEDDGTGQEGIVDIGQEEGDTFPVEPTPSPSGSPLAEETTPAPTGEPTPSETGSVTPAPSPSG